MATTSAFGWETPDDTDLVKDGAAAIRTLGNSIDTSMSELKGGTTGQVLSKTSNTDMDFTWVAQDDSNAIQNSIVDAKGDLIAATANDTPARLAVGANGTSLVADSSTATGLAYASRATLGANTFTADQSINDLSVGRGVGNSITNTVFGSGCLSVNTTGLNNVAVGYLASRDNTTGGGNTAVGVGAAALTTTGELNTSLGRDAMVNNTTGSLNTYVGYVAGQNNTSGASNSGSGVGALAQVTTGGFNSGVGRDCGSGLTTGSNNSFLGYLSAPSSATVSNTVTLGNSSITTLRCQVTSITSLSDQRDKKDIVPLEHGLDFINQLKPVSFEWNTRPETITDVEGNEIELPGKIGIADIGFIAQDIVALEDSLGAADSLKLSYRDNPEKLEVTQGRLIPILVKAIQDLTAKVEALEAQTK